MIGMAVAMGIGRFGYTPILPYMTEALSLTKSDAGLIAAANYLGYLFGALAGVIGTLGGNRRSWMLWSLATTVLFTAAMAVDPSPYAFMALRFCGGLASALFMVFGSALVFERLAAAGRSDLTHVYFMGVGAGICASALLVAWLGASGIGWDGQWIASGALALAGFVAVFFLIPRATNDSPQPMPAGGSQLDRRIVPMAVAYGLFGFGYVITMTFISAIARQTPAIAAIEPYIWFVVGVAALPSAAFWLWIGRRFGNPTSFALASLIEAMGVAATVLFTDASLVLVGAVLTGGTVVGILALGLSVARDFAQSSGIDPRRIIAIMTCAFGLGQVIGPAFAGYVADITGTFTVPTLVATATLLLAAALGLVVRKQAPGNLRT